MYTSSAPSPAAESSQLLPFHLKEKIALKTLSLSQHCVRPLFYWPVFFQIHYAPPELSKPEALQIGGQELL